MSSTKKIPASKRLVKNLGEGAKYNFYHEGKEYPIQSRRDYDRLSPVEQQSLLTLLSNLDKEKGKDPSKSSSDGNGKSKPSQKPSKNSGNRLVQQDGKDRKGEKQKSKSNKDKGGRSEDKEGKNRGESANFDDKGETVDVSQDNEERKRTIIREFLLRLAERSSQRKKWDARRGMVKFFTEPHLTFRPKKETRKSSLPVLVIGSNTHYHEQDQDLHSVLLEEANLLGFDVVTSRNLVGEYSFRGEPLGTWNTYFLDLMEEHPFKDRKVMVFYQGCGFISSSVVWSEEHKSRVEHFTCFDHFSDCGCNQLRIARNQGVTMHEDMGSYEAFANWRRT